ncbi:MBL fold metallo-hydrolase [Neptuniibacter halophilus]|uniref:MBL fold metallo-hydrolase n=1 Tax=Neptuniibacter halophilus TaxID=651666 RepID=UPI002573C8BC|nr:MBL fold metallo-hydrolase [Neptuniibacter halophilus]
MSLLRRIFTPLLMGVVLHSPAYAEEHHQQSASFKAKSLTGQITMLQGKGGNIGILSGEQGVLMIDDDYQHMTPALQQALTEFGGEDKLTYIINTHWHGDHTQGNLHFGKHAQIIAHDNVRHRLLTSQEVKLFNMKTEPYPEHALPSITYQKALTLHMNGETVEIVHLPGGHTDGDSVVFFRQANVVHMGDHFFNGFFPFVDVQNGGNVSRMAKNVGTVLDMIDDKTIVIPGHGPVSNKAELAAFKAMLEGTLAEVKAMRVAGMNLGQMQVKGLSSEWDDWTDGFLSSQVWIGILNSSLEKP